MTFTDELCEEAAVDHRFTERLVGGTIDDVFRRYLLQDYAFVGALVEVFGHAVGEAPTLAAKSRLVDFLETLTADENNYFERSYDALGIPEETYVDPDTASTTRTFQNLLERAGREGGCVETLAVLIPAEWIYGEWAIAANTPPEPFYLRECVGLHANEAFVAFVEWLRKELKREGAEASDRRRWRVGRLFRRTVELEVAFFEAAYYANDGSDRGEGRW